MTGIFATAVRGVDAEFVRAKSAMGVPTSAIARMVSRPVSEIQPFVVASAARAAFVATKPAKAVVKPPVDAAPAHPTMIRITTEVAQRYGVTMEEMRGKSQARRCAWPRGEAMAIIYRNTGFSLPQIGRFFGWRDHTTVLWAIRAYDARIAGVPLLRPRKDRAA